MAVNREGRDELADKLAALMRGDILVSDLKDMDSIYDEDQTTDKLLGSCHYHFLIRLGKRRSDRLRVKEDEWSCFKRWLVILQTDIDWGSDDQQKENDEPVNSSKTRILLGILYILVVILLTTGFLLKVHATRIAYLTIGLITSAIIVCGIVFEKDETSSSYYPFTTEAELQKYQSQITSLNIPVYEPTVHGIANKFPLKEILLSAPVVLFLFVLAVTFWPIAAILWIGEFGKKPASDAFSPPPTH